MPDLTALLTCFEPIDAARPDTNFLKKFVLHEDMQLLIRDEAFIITGEKGSGKTALCRYMEEQISNSSTFVKGIFFNDLRHADITHYIANLAHLSGIDSLSLMSAFWRCVIAISGMQFAFEHNKLNLTFGETRLVHFLRETGHLDRAPIDIFLHLVRKVWELIDTVTEPSNAAAAVTATRLGFPPNKQGIVIDERQLTHLRKYPFSDKHYLQAENDFAKYLSDKNYKIVIYLDGFDKLRGDGPHDTDALNLLFYSLIDATYSLATDAKWINRLVVKALIPHDRWLEQRPRDIDKWRDIHQSIIWRYSNLKEFIRKRLVLHSDLQDNITFESAWAHFFPEKITNNCYGVSEGAFDYILRHTQYRPRQLQSHFIRLCKAFKDKPVVAAEIPNIIALSCMKRVTDFIEEFRIDHPQLETFLGKFQDCPNVLRYEDLYNWVSDALRKMNVQDIDPGKKLEKLYHIGFVGSLRRVEEYEYESKKHAFYFAPTRVDSKKYRSEFYYEDGAPQAFRNLSPDDLVCIHPMFYDYCKLKANEKYIVG